MSYGNPQDEIAVLKAALTEASDELIHTKALLEESSYRLEEANDMIEAIRSGELDALVLKTNNKHELYTLNSSDQAYRIFIEQMTAGAVTLNKNGAILYSNSRFAEMIDVPLESITGKFFCDYAPVQEKNRCKLMIDNAWQQGLKKESVLMMNMGAEFPVLLSMQRLDLAEGISLSIIINDLSQQKEQQRLLEEKNVALEQAQQRVQDLNANLEQTVKDRTQELYANQERLSRILETMAEGVGIIDTTGRLTYANPMAQKILGLTLSEIQERTYDDPKWANLRIDGSPLPDGEHPMAIMMSTGKPVYDHEIGVQPDEGERFYISINAAPILNESGKIIAGIGTFMDVTHRRKALQHKDEFISVASHELRTPITSLKATLQLLDRMKINVNMAIFPKLVEQANRSLNRVSVLIDDLLNATKMNHGQLSLNKKEFAIAELIEESCQHVRSEGNFDIKIIGKQDLKIIADYDKIEQVLVNFINNAVKYAAESKTIEILLSMENEMAKVAVVDFGPGIPSAKLPHLFDRYYRVDTGGHQYSGLGLGLYICAEIVKKHEGKIGVKSVRGQGSTFWFTLPMILSSSPNL